MTSHLLHAMVNISFTLGSYGYSVPYLSRQFAENFHVNDLPYVFLYLDKSIRLYTAHKSLYNKKQMHLLRYRFYLDKEGERMYEMPTDLQYKDELRKEEIRIEDELELLEKKDYEQLEKQLKRNLERIRKTLQD